MTGNGNDRNHHLRMPTEFLAGCSDVGSSRHFNQDAFSLAAKPGGHALAAVSDGVSTAADSELASLVAVDAAREVLVHKTDQGFDANAALNVAFEVAQAAVIRAAGEAPPSACTLIACVVTPDRIVVGNVGDSRAYWLGDDGTNVLLSTDDSMAEARVQLGMTRAEAEASAQAHTITRWLGREALDVTPTICSHEPTGPGWFVMCTDGLWNYASPPEELGAVVRGLAASQPSPAGLAEALVAWAKGQGGHDNITVVVARRP